MVEQSALRWSQFEEGMRVVGRHKNIARFKIATAGAAQARHKPVVENRDVLSSEVAADPRSVDLFGGQHHEARGVMRTAAKWPTSGNMIAAFNRDRGADRTRCARHEGARIAEPVAHGSLVEVAADTAHSTAVADQPANRAVEGGGGLHNLHEFEWRQFRSAERPRQPEAKQPRIGQRLEYGLRQSAAAVEVVAR